MSCGCNSKFGFLEKDISLADYCRRDNSFKNGIVKKGIKM